MRIMQNHLLIRKRGTRYRVSGASVSENLLGETAGSDVIRQQISGKYIGVIPLYHR